jgi:hypothetical protein
MIDFGRRAAPIEMFWYEASALLHADRLAA